MYQDSIKEQINIDIELPQQFYEDLIYSEINIIYYGEKIASILYKKLNNFNLSKIEKQHQDIIKKIIKKQQPLDNRIFLFFKNIIKSKNHQVYTSFLKSLEHYSIFRYKALISVINDKEIKDLLNEILEDELKHFVKYEDLEYKSNFHGFENKTLFLKYENILKISYDQFRQKMWNTIFYQKIRGII